MSNTQEKQPFRTALSVEYDGVRNNIYSFRLLYYHTGSGLSIGISSGIVYAVDLYALSPAAVLVAADP